MKNKIEIDKGVLETCNWFNNNGFPTGSSCSGHPKWLRYNYSSCIDFCGDYQEQIEKLFGGTNKIETSLLFLEVHTYKYDDFIMTQLSLAFKKPQTQKQINESWKQVLEFLEKRKEENGKMW